jgi:signal transduction histidine kinase
MVLKPLLFIVLLLMLLLIIIFLSVLLVRNNQLNKKNELETQRLISEITTDLMKIRNELKAKNTELLESLDQIKELEQLKKSMTEMIVHDLKNPLNVILGLSKNELVLNSGKTMLNLVNNILDVEKYSDTTIPLNKTKENINEITADVIRSLQFQIELYDITISNQTDSVSVFSDRELIERVLTNMLINALKYSPNGEEIIVSTKDLPDDKIKISVIDKGPGISKEKTELIFERYVKDDTKTTGVLKSTGIGLAFCRMAINAHNGAIGVSSEMNKGSTFWFTLQKYSAH